MFRNYKVVYASSLGHVAPATTHKGGTSMFATLALSLLAPMAGAAEEPTPVTSAIVEIVIADPATGGPLCDAYGTVIDAIDGMGLDPESRLMFVDVTDAYAIVSIEGDAMRLDNDARDTLTGWLHTNCS